MTARKTAFRVGAEEARTVGDVLARMGADDRAVEEGRVFVGRRRVRSRDEGLRAGDLVEISPPREGPTAVPVLARSDDLVAVEKPAGMPTIADHAGSAHTLIAAAARALGVDPARLHPTSRLDRDVSGAVVFALTKGARERLAHAREAGTYERRYIALSASAPEPILGTWNAPIGRARDPRLRAAHGRDAAAAETRYALCARARLDIAMLAVAPKTGRTHQIRVHAAAAGAPLLGDSTYGGPARLTLATGRVLELRRVALHAARVVVPSARGGSLVAVSAVPPELAEVWSALGGDAAAWERALECPV